MFAVVASGLQKICKTQRELDTILAVYPYPKFQYVQTEEEGRDWLRRNKRNLNDFTLSAYGDTVSYGYARVQYAILENEIHYTLDTTKLGYIKAQSSENVAVMSRQGEMQIVVSGVKLDNSLIAHHVIAIRRLLRIVGEFVDIDVVIPDMSIYLALYKYTGNDYNIKRTQREINTRLGGFSVTLASKLHREEIKS